MFHRVALLAYTLVILGLAACSYVAPNEYGSGDKLRGSQSLPIAWISGECDVTPTFVEGRAPIFPPTLMATYDRRKEHYAKVRFTVTAEGRVKDAKVTEASHPQFAAGIGHVLPTWRFLPAVREGKPVEVVVETSWNFTLIL